ncbi:MAG: hypothetical protein FWH17_08530 [Oscillospiraceae bacterium]|nr:hypothetical protein [Oscillospiraceae bacterium]
MKKIHSIALAVILVISLIFSLTSTTEASNGDEDFSSHISLHVLSGDIPESATEYARFYFSTFTPSELIDLGFSQREVESLRLAPGITAYEYSICDAPFYYFPAVSEQGIVAVMTIIDFGDSNYSAQFGKSSFATALNNINTRHTEPVALVISNEGMYALDAYDNFTLLDTFFILNDVNLRSIVEQSISIELHDIKYDIVKNSFQTIVEISEFTIYDEKIQTGSLRNTEEKYLNVLFVANGTNANFPGGYCWASSAASILKFRSSLPLTAIQWRDTLLANSANNGSDSNIKSILEFYLNIAATISDPRLNFANIKTQINNNKPIYSHWETNNVYVGHAMVVRGYYSFDGQPSVWRVSLMDPNHTTYQTVDPSGSYVIGPHIMYWTTSVH